MRLILKPADIRYEGLEVAVEGFDGDSGVTPAQVFIEIHEGALKVHVFSEPENPVSFTFDKTV